MTRACQTCNSPLLKEIEDMMGANWGIKEIERELKARHQGMRIPSYDSLKSHYRYHFKGPIEKEIESSEERSKIIRKEIKASIEGVRLVSDNLSKLSEMIQKVWEDGIDSPDARREIGTLIWRINQTIEILFKYAEKVEGLKITEDELLDRLLYCIADMPEDMIKQVKERWNSYGSPR